MSLNRRNLLKGIGLLSIASFLGIQKRKESQVRKVLSNIEKSLNLIKNYGHIPSLVLVSDADWDIVKGSEYIHGSDSFTIQRASTHNPLRPVKIKRGESLVIYKVNDGSVFQIEKAFHSKDLNTNGSIEKRFRIVKWDDSH